MTERAKFKQQFNKGRKLASKRRFEAVIREFKQALAVKSNDLARFSNWAMWPVRCVSIRSLSNGTTLLFS